MKINEKKEELDDNAVTTDVILEKTENKGIFQIKSKVKIMKELILFLFLMLNPFLLYIIS